MSNVAFDLSKAALPANPNSPDLLQPVTTEYLIELLEQGNVELFNKHRPKEGIKIEDKEFRGTVLAGVDLAFCELNRVRFTRCDLLSSKWQKAKLCAVEIVECCADGSDFSGADIQRAIIDETKLRESIWDSAYMRYSRVLASSLERSRFNQSKFWRSELSASFDQAIFINDNAICQSALNGCKFTRSNLSTLSLFQSQSNDLSIDGSDCRKISNWPHLWGVVSADGAYLDSEVGLQAAISSEKVSAKDVLKKAKIGKVPPNGEFAQTAANSAPRELLVDGLAGTDLKLFKEAELQLEALVGLSPVKEWVKEYVDFLRIQKIRQRQGLGASEITTHFIFEGCPGTGKSTVARILGKFLKSFGVLSSGQFIEVSRADLVAEYLGQTAPRTNKILESAKGGVLFIDEAYALAPEGGRDSFGQEAIATILKYMEDNRNDISIIVAGYPEPMRRLISSNPGLKSRFTEWIDFKNYTDIELTEILGKMAKANGYSLEPGANSAIQRHFGTELATSGADFGNARAARNLFEHAIRRQASRLIKEGGEITKQRLELLQIRDIL